MKLTKIDLSKIVAIAHNNGQLGLLIDRGIEIEYIEIPAPEVAYDGLQQVSNFANNRAILGGNQDPILLDGSLPLDRCEESRFLPDPEEEEEDEPLIELECDEEDGEEYYYPIDVEAEEDSQAAIPCDQLLNVQVPGYS
ncbi:hypothetical protein ACL6C3_01100 [Capilliphycus salinus ALCB114379]|uniref:hypothetical protein n=1 Tax=Capilliphycus salinus TaxID=2768948 RepID=UPI0039A5C6B1